MLNIVSFDSEDDDYEDDDEDNFHNEADGVHLMPDSDQGGVVARQNGGGGVAGMVIFEGGEPMLITPRGVNILAEENQLDILDSAVGRNEDDLVDGENCCLIKMLNLNL